MASRPPPPPAAPTHLLRTHSSPVSALSISPDNERIYSGDASGLIVVTSTRSLRPITTWNAHTDSLLGIEEWEEHIITDNKLHVWTRVEELPASARLGGTTAQSATDLPRPTLCYSMDVNALNYCRFSLLALPDPSKGALVALPNLVDSTSADVWVLPSRERIHAAIGQAGKTAIFNSDPAERSKTGLIMSLHLYGVARDASVPSSSQAVSPPQAQELRLLCAYESGSVTLRRYARTDKATSVEGKGWEVIWDAKLHVESNECRAVMAMRVSRANDVALTVSADHLVGRYDLTAANVDGCVAHRTKHPGNGAVAIRDDGRVCAVAGWDGSIRLYATRTMKPLGALRYHKTGCQAVEFAWAFVADDGGDDGEESGDEMDQEEKVERARWLVGGGKDNRVSIWSLTSFEKT
ncbi:hypothetical protein D9615_004317 [Tricholomella constricta]|uniref:ASTRA-associated protein 1 n=1 Tax=Tricholomella constricta TaxID=117010 RepID=A0A8H5HF24_9AGAR|nr:hypothetical protein D9615_004317 [Tricholomella constricta]